MRPEGAAFVVHCAAGHTWTAIRLPMSLALAARALKRATCPECGSIKVFCGPAPQPDAAPSAGVSIVID